MRLVPTTLCIAGLLGAPAVIAQDDWDPSARAHLEAGVEHYRAQRFEDAIREFEAGYGIDPRAEFLYAWAQAERSSGDCASAVELYDRFLETDPSEERRAAAKRNKERCEPVDPQPAAAEKPPPPTSPVSPAPPASAAPPPATAPPSPTVSPPIEPTAPIEPDWDPWYRSAWGGALTSAGVFTAGIGGVLLLSSQSKERSARRSSETADPDYTLGDHRSRLDTAETYRRAGLATVGLGSALVASGIAAYVVSSRGQRRVGVWVEPGSIGASYTGAF